MYFVGVYCCGTEASGTNFSLQLTWLIPSYFFFYILYIKIYTTRATEIYRVTRSMIFFLVFGFRNEKQCQVKDRIFRRRKKKIENVMKKEAQISDIIYACFYKQREGEKVFFYFVFRTLFICFFDSSLFVMNCND